MAYQPKCKDLSLLSSEQYNHHFPAFSCRERYTRLPVCTVSFPCEVNAVMGLENTWKNIQSWQSQWASLKRSMYVGLIQPFRIK